MLAGESGRGTVRIGVYTGESLVLPPTLAGACARGGAVLGASLSAPAPRRRPATRGVPRQAASVPAGLRRSGP
jgi:hypothetical protein